MTKKTFHYITEAGWLLLALLPLILYLVAMRNTDAGTIQTFEQMMTEKLGFFYTESNVIYTAIDSIFGTEGIMPIMTDAIVLYLTYYITCELIHLVADVLLFIPRLAQSWINAFTSKLGG